MWLRIARYFEIGAIEEVLVSVRLHHEGNFVRDPERIIEFMPYVLKKSFTNNNQIGQLYKNQVYTQIYFHHVLEMLNKWPNKLKPAWLTFFRGVIRWPFDPRTLIIFERLLFRTFVPNMIKPYLRQLWRRQQGSGEDEQ